MVIRYTYKTGGIVESEEGPFVKYEEHEKLLAAKDKNYKELKFQTEQLRSQLFQINQLLIARNIV